MHIDRSLVISHFDCLEHLDDRHVSTWEAEEAANFRTAMERAELAEERRAEKDIRGSKRRKVGEKLKRMLRRRTRREVDNSLLQVEVAF